MECCDVFSIWFGIRKLLEIVEHSSELRSAGNGGRARIKRIIAIRTGDGFALRCEIARHIRQLDRIPLASQVTHEALRDLSLVEGISAAFGDLLERPCEIRI